MSILDTLLIVFFIGAAIYFIPIMIYDALKDFFNGVKSDVVDPFMEGYTGNSKKKTVQPIKVSSATTKINKVINSDINNSVNSISAFIENDINIFEYHDCNRDEYSDQGIYRDDMEPLLEWMTKNSVTMDSILGFLDAQEIAENDNLSINLDFTNEPLHPNIFLLKNLKYLTVQNGLKYLDPRISNLENLVELDLGMNNLSTIPSEIANLNQLKVLSLFLNNIKMVPDEILLMPNLKVLDLRENPIHFSDHQKKLIHQAKNRGMDINLSIDKTNLSVIDKNYNPFIK